MQKTNIVNLRNIYILSILNCIYLITVYGWQWHPDTASYVRAWDSFSQLEIDMWRTPVYPVFLGIAKGVLGNSHFLFYCTIIHHCIFLISIYYFYRILYIITGFRQVSLYLTAFYALYPCIATWNCYAITEPLAIYGMIFLIYCALIAYKKQTTLHLIGFAIWSLFLVFLRPAQMYILPVFIVSWILLYLKDRRLTKTVIGGIIAVIFTTSLLIAYCTAFYYQHHIFSPSGIGVINKYYLARIEGNITADNTPNEKFKSFINKSIEEHGVRYTGGSDEDLYTESEEAISIFGLREVSNTVTPSSPNVFRMYKEFIQRFHKAANDKLFATYIHQLRNITDIIGVRLNIVYIILIIYSFILASWIFKMKSIPWFSITLFMLGFSHLFVIIYACQNVWDRLITPALPIYLFILGQLMSTFKLRRESFFQFE